MTVNEKERLTSFPQNKAKKQCFDCCSTVHSHSKVFLRGIDCFEVKFYTQQIYVCIECLEP